MFRLRWFVQGVALHCPAGQFFGQNVMSSQRLLQVVSDVSHHLMSRVIFTLLRKLKRVRESLPQPHKISRME